VDKFDFTYMLGLDVIFFSISMSLLFSCLLVFNIKKLNKKEKKIGGEDAEFYFFF
jgi:hypothetical protein